jgi:hypothetical protein
LKGRDSWYNRFNFIAFASVSKSLAKRETSFGSSAGGFGFTRLLDDTGDGERLRDGAMAKFATDSSGQKR